MMPVLAAVLAFLVAGCSGSAEEEDGPVYEVGTALTDSTYAVVASSEYGTDTLTTEQYRRQIGVVARRLGADPNNPRQQRDLHRQLVDRFVTRHVMDGAAQRAGIEVDSAQVEGRLQRVRRRFSSETEMRRALAQQGVATDSLRRMAVQSVRREELWEQMAGDVEPPTPEEVETYRQEERRRQFQIRNILIRTAPEAPEDTVAAARRRAQTLIDSLGAGADFETLAFRYSEGPAAREGGLLSYRSSERLLTPVAEAARALQDSGDVVTEPVRSRLGFHVVQLAGEREARPMTKSAARWALITERQKEAVQEAQRKLKRKVTVRVHPGVVEADLGPAGSEESG